MSRPGYPVRSGRAPARLAVAVTVIVIVVLAGSCGVSTDDRLHGVDMWWCSRTKTVVFSSMGTQTSPLDDNKLYALDLPTGRVRVLLTTEDCLDTPVLSPDGMQLACRVPTAGRSALLVGRADGMHMRKIALPTDRWFWPNAFAMKGGAVVLSSLREVPGRGFAARPSCEADFWLASLTTGRVRRITTGNFHRVARPGVSADGRTLTFIATPPYREVGNASFLYQCSMIGDGRLKRL